MTVFHSNISIMQLGKMTREEIEKELISTGLSSVAVQGIIDVLSLESLSKLEGFLLICCCWLVINLLCMLHMIYLYLNITLR